MRRPDSLLAVLAVTGLSAASVVLVALPAGADDEPTPTPTATPTVTERPADGPVEVDDAVLRWGLNNESNNRAFAPGTYNFFTAGKLPDPGRGGTTIRQADWKQAAGDVEIEKWNGSRYVDATWAGLSTDSAGRPLGSATAGTFSNHQFVFSGGAGEVDRAAGTATIAWDGDVSVLYYSGMSFFYLSDPVLEVADGAGTLTATMQGYASSLEDTSEWEAVAPAEVTLADLPEVDLAELGFAATPSYLGVSVSGVPQAADSPYFGSFPQSYVAYADRLGTAAFWYSSNGATDAFKVPLPLAVSYDASAVVPQPTPTQPAETDDPIEPPTIKPPPTPTPTPTDPTDTPTTASPTATTPPAAAVQSPPPSVSLPVVVVPSDVAAAAALPPSAQLVAAAPAAVSTAPARAGARLWWAGGALLLAAGVLLTLPTIPRRTRKVSP